MKEQRKCPEDKEKHRRKRQLNEHWGGHKREFGLLFCHQISPATSLLKTIGSAIHYCVVVVQLVAVVHVKAVLKKVV